ncbi:MAG: DUF885 domain-containing protein [Candidatus Melainabacteria bacterium]|nr:DUF885 domain-containing protein [Candidatus Melainabacteria bacterium]
MLNYSAKKNIRSVIALALTLVCSVSSLTPALAKSEADVEPPLDDSLAKLGDQYIDYLFKSSPSMATSAGVHTYDSDVSDFSQTAIKTDIEDRKAFLEKLNKISYSKLSPNAQIDWNLMCGNLNQSLLDNEKMKLWQKDPDLYSSSAIRSVFSIVQRDFAPLDVRLKSVIAREEKLPVMLAQGKQNLDPEQVPEIYNDIALEQLPGMIDFFSTSLPQVFSKIKDEALLKQFSTTNEKAIAALKDYQMFVKEKLKGKSKGSFVIGKENFSRKILCEELIEEPLDEVLDKGMTELRKLQADFKEAAKKVNPDVDPVVAFESISSDHPTGDKLLEATRGVLEEIRKFCVDKPICKVPSEERAQVDETPAFNRALSFASMDTPGPFEKNAREAFYYVTLPEKDWDAKRTEEHLRSFSYCDLINTSVHEAYPGHYTQFLWVNTVPSTVRKVFGCSSNDEGWAHYCEQMMLDEGFHADDPKLRLVQIHDALLRVCRYIVGIRMHTKGMSMDEGIKFFIDEGYVEKANAERETKRGTSDPTYLVYTYGKLQILALRKEVQEKDPGKYSISEFHNHFLKEGFPPVSLVRAKMLKLPVKKYF